MYKKDNNLIEYFNDQYSFTKEQKNAILVSLYEIANSDEEFHEHEAQYLKKISGYMGYSLGNRKLQKLLDTDKDHLYGLLKDLSESQKDWYVFIALGMVWADGVVVEKEFIYVENFLLGIGFSKKRISRNMSLSTTFYMYD